MVIKLIILLALSTITSFGQTLTLMTESFEFGEIGNISPVSRDITYKNSGDKELIIDRVKASCGCTAGTPSKMNLAPGESGTLNVTFNPQGRSGLQKKSVRFYSNDPGQQVKKLDFTANVVPVWETIPKVIEFQMNDTGDQYLKSDESFTIRNKGDKPLKIEKVYSSNPNFIVDSLAPVDLASAGTSNVSVKIKPDFIAERYTYGYVFVTGKIDDRPTTERVRVIIKTAAKNEGSGTTNTP